MAAEAVAGETRVVEFGILGPLEVRRSGQAVPLGGPRQRAVLALLPLEANGSCRWTFWPRTSGAGSRPRGGPGHCRPMCFTCAGRWTRAAQQADPPAARELWAQADRVVTGQPPWVPLFKQVRDLVRLRLGPQLPGVPVLRWAAA